MVHGRERNFQQRCNVVSQNWKNTIGLLDGRDVSLKRLIRSCLRENHFRTNLIKLSRRFDVLVLEKKKNRDFYTETLNLNN